MGYYKIRGALVVTGGSVQLGADTGLYRNSANVLKTDDALTVAGTLTASGTLTAAAAINASGTVTATKKIDASGATALLAPYATASPTIDTNGHVSFVQKSDRSYLTFHCGGTPFHVMFPQTTHGTVTCTVGGTP